MKLALASDLHLEFGPIVLENTEDADVLLLSGDICVARDLVGRELVEDYPYSQIIHNFFYDCCNKFPHVVYVMGNHEHYNYDYKNTLKNLKKHLKYLPNLQILERKSWTLFDEVTFIGGTLWTDMNKEDSMTQWYVAKCMNDFRIISKDGRRLQPEDVVKDFKSMVKYIDKVTKDKYDHKFVVVGHHPPSKTSTKPWYKDDVLMNGAYSSDLNQFILDRPQIKLWTHGHTHDDFDYMVGTTRVVCNPRGYINYEARADNFQLKYLEV